MNPHILLISDLHLSDDRPDITALFFQFLQQTAPHAEQLYILGDFFEVWLGDDDDQPLGHAVSDTLAQLAAAGTAIFILHGNRDFLLGDAFMQRSHAALLPDCTVIDLFDTPTLLMHGDTLCLADESYQAFRKQVRDPRYQQAFLAKPLAERKAIAAHLRSVSKQETSLKAEAIMDVTPAEVDRLMSQYGVSRLIHGHTHRPAIHSEKNGQRIVLAAWETQGHYLLVDSTGCYLKDF